MGKSGKLFTSFVNGVKALKSPSTREKSTTEDSSARKDRNSVVSKHGCMWTLGKSSSRNKGSACAPLHAGVEVKDVQVHPLCQGPQPPASSFHYTDASLEEIASNLAEDIVREEPTPQEPYEEHWATILKSSDDEAEPEEGLHQDTTQEEQAAVRIQAAIRRYLAYQKFNRAMRALIRLQAMARGRMARNQVAATLRSIHAVVRLQANARGWLARKSEIGTLVRLRIQDMTLQNPNLPVKGSQSEQPMHHQSITNCKQQSSEHIEPLISIVEPEEEYRGWAWLDRWNALRQPWQNSSSYPVAKEEAGFMASVDGVESDIVVDEDAEIATNIAEKKHDSMIDTPLGGELVSSGSLPAVQEVPLPPPPPPPPPPHPVLFKAFHPSIEDPVLRADKDPSECSTLILPPIISGAMEESTTEDALLSSPLITPAATVPVSLDIPTESASCFLKEDNLLSSISVVSELSLPEAAHSTEPEDITLVATEDDLGMCADVATPSAPASSGLQQSESSSPPSFLTKEEDRPQDRTPISWQATDSQEEQTSASRSDPVSIRDEAKTPIGSAYELLEHLSDLSTQADISEKASLGTKADNIGDNTKARDITELEENVKGTKNDLVECSNGTREGYVQTKRRGSLDASASPVTLAEASGKRIGSISVKNEEGDQGVHQSLPSYMATTKSSKAKVRSQASPKPMPESPKQRLASPRHSSASRKSPASEGKGGSFADAKQIVHMRAGSKGQIGPLMKDGSIDSSFRSLGDSKRHAK